ncbi:unnamed protein product [Phytophthora lilii]|uniref:Probable pectate lyase F n=1 Tax=Phytophthora lilii TaxID=2077276 RepID=A0A9W6X1X8_9STRA|nr:unnamed protein product [Phytophthora lilii]
MPTGGEHTEQRELQLPFAVVDTSFTNSPPRQQVAKHQPNPRTTLPRSNMVKSVAPIATSAALLIAATTAASLPDGSWPASTGTVQFAEAHIIKAGEVFDGKMQTFERSDISCEGQTESGANTAVFKLEPGATLKNAIIGKNQMEGVHCDKHDCTIDNVWWDDVCEDALSIKGGTASSVSKVIGGGARYADDKVIQHNGYGTVEIDGFYGEDISKLYRSCGTCGDKARKVSVSNGNANGEPKILGHGPSAPLCQYSESDVHINEDISQAAQTSTSSTSSSSAATQTASSASTASSTASSASTGSASSQTPTQASSSSTVSSTSASASTSSQASSNSSTDASQAIAPGTVSPVESGSFEQSVVSTDASQAEQHESTEAPTHAASASASSSGSLYLSSDDVSQTAVQQSSVASSSATDLPQTDVVLECDSTSGSNTGATSSPSSVASSNAADASQTNVVLECDSSSGSSTEQVGMPTQHSSSASASSSSNIQSQDQTTPPNASGSASSSTSPTSSTNSAVGSATQSSATGSTTQSSSTGSNTQSSGSDSTQQTTTNSTVSVPDGTWPASTGTVLYSKPYTIKAGEVFDGKMQTFERSDITCSEGEGQKDTAVFLVEAGGTLKNAIIGKNQKEGVHCDDHACTIENVWWDDVCEDALSIKGGTASSVTTVTNCGARYASDKVVQHNGYGTVKINGFFAQEFGKLYRSCGTCGDIPRTVTVENVYAIDPLVSVVTVNKNYNDQATLRNIYVKTTDGKDDVKVCQWSQGSMTPSNLGDGPSGTLCQYSESDIHINEE